jgi:shikimate dehydrogenase
VFSKSIQPHLNKTHKRALILGTGGASKAIAYALECLGIEVRFVSRKNHNKEIYKYEDLHTQDIKEHTIIINSTPLGTYPNTEDCPNIPYGELSENHLVYDLIYNPMETKFLKYGKKAGAKTINGLEMLHLQAEKSWEIWHL